MPSHPHLHRLRSLVVLGLATNLVTAQDRNAPDPVAAWLARPAAERGAAPATPLTRSQAETVRQTLAAEAQAQRGAALADAFERKTLTWQDKSMRWLEKTFGDAPAGQRSLWISMHGGGGAPARVNDQQWQNQIRLYEPQEGIYVAPRAPTDTWNLWHEGHIDPLFAALIEGMVALRGVDPDRVYLLGYSAGGDGVWQLAPRMADRFAAAAMMAGHPNEARLLSLRNLPFAIFMGGKDAAYDRNKIAAARGEELAALQKADPGGYRHLVRIYPEHGHWMNRQDAEALPWLAQFRRQPWPHRIVWYQDDVTHERAYWLQVPKEAAKAGTQITAELRERRIVLAGDVPAGLSLLLADELLDLDEPLTVVVGEREVFAGKVERTAGAIAAALQARPDLRSTPTAILVLP